jgi:phage replication-related protein YjqB (UPF0714/DUF867 family)
MTGKYDTFEALSRCETEGSDYRIRSRSGTSGIAVIAIHGGGIEPGTTEIAEAIAGEHHAFYTFSGIKSAGNFCLHITSANFDEPLGIALAAMSQTVLTIHGCEDDAAIVYIGGRNTALRQEIDNCLRRAKFSVCESERFPGLNRRNICNRCRLKMGVQLEISMGLRRLMFGDLVRAHRKKPGPEFYKFVAAVRQALSQ